MTFQNSDFWFFWDTLVNIAKLVNEINDFDVGIPRAEMRAAEERGECKRLLQQVHSGNVVRLPNLEGRLTLARGEVTVVHRHLDQVCHKYLPVWINHEEVQAQWFLEPISRVLRKTSNQLPCSAALQGFQAVDSRFYRALSPSPTGGCISFLTR